MKFSIPLFLLFAIASQAQTKILFDASRAQSAGNADWVIDADQHNLGFFSGPATLGGSESNAQTIPSPAQSGITAATPETFWNGALSYWAVDCVKQGYTVETLPYNGQITYGNASNSQDLTHYKVFVIDEPNIQFTASEKDAIITFVSNGGGLCIISDHTISDRNNDGVDSPQVLNDLLHNNNIQPDAFGLAFDYADLSQTSSNIANLPVNPILHGPAGNVAKVQWSSGTTITLTPADNASVTGLVYKTGSATTGTTNAMCASAVYHSGKVVAIGDSSIADDGTGDSNDVLYNGYTGDASGNHQKLLVNAIIWLATPNPLAIANFGGETSNFTISPNPVINDQLVLYGNRNEALSATIAVYNATGQLIRSSELAPTQEGKEYLSLSGLTNGVYWCRITSGSKTETHTFLVDKQ